MGGAILLSAEAKIMHAPIWAGSMGLLFDRAAIQPWGA